VPEEPDRRSAANDSFGAQRATYQQQITETKGNNMTLTTNPEDNEAVGGPSWAHDEILHAWWILPGRLLAGEYPGPLNSAKAAHKRQVLLDAGVSSFINRTEAGELAGGGQPSGHYHPLICAEAKSRGLMPSQDPGARVNENLSKLGDAIKESRV